MDIHWELKPLPGKAGWMGIIRVPIEGPHSGKSIVSATATAKKKDDAILKAASIAETITQNPVIASLLPPGTPLALEATKRIAAAVKAGTVDDEIRKIAGPAAKRLASALKSLNPFD